jgi:hypothetical protein
MKATGVAGGCSKKELASTSSTGKAGGYYCLQFSLRFLDCR